MSTIRTYSDNHGLPGWRLKFVLWVLLGFALVLVGRLFYLQVIQGSFLASKAEQAHQLVREIDPPRGRIYDRNGKILASNITVYRLYATPQYVEDPESAAQQLSPLIGVPAKEIADKLKQDVPWVSIATRLTTEQKEKIEALHIPGIGFEPQTARAYPNGSLAAQVLGFTNFENVGSYGVEGEYNNYLSGEPGKMIAEQDPAGNWIPVAQRQVIPPKPGADVQLTIDATVQYYAEEVLQKTVKEQKAKGGSIIVMDPYTGEILAMASYPTFNPQEFYNVRNTSVFANPAISSAYEPGSTFKIITMAAGLAAGVITPDTRIDDKGYLNVYGYTIHNWDGRPHPNESMTEVLMNSANVGAAYVSTKLGEDRFYRKVQDFGFGAKTGIDLQGEATGILVLPSSKNWSPINLYTNAYGQGIAVTPIQLITAQAAVANGGLLMRPYVVSKIERNGKVIKENRPTVVRRVLSRQVAETLKSMMKTVVEEGEYQVARIPGYSVGGKTGTASVPVNGQYDPNVTIASFIGYSPVKHPKFIALIKIDQPKGSRWGSEVAAPAFKELARKLYTYYNIPPDQPEQIETSSGEQG